MADRQAINDLWGKYIDNRASMAANAGKPSYREYIWQEYLRFDYTPEDCRSFHAAIEQVVVPAATRIYERHRQKLGVDKLRPWDLPDGWFGRPVGAGGHNRRSNLSRTWMISNKKLAACLLMLTRSSGLYFKQMQAEKLLDLDNRKNKAPGSLLHHLCAVLTQAIRVHERGRSA